MRKFFFGVVLILVFALAGPVRAAALPVTDWTLLKQAVAMAAPGETLILAGDLIADSEISIGKSLTVKGGGYTVRPAEGYRGGALVLKNADVTIEDIHFNGFSKMDGDASAGGAVFSTGGTLTLRRCDFLDNASDNSGGALYHSTGKLIIADCTFSRNSARTSDGASGFGGAVLNDGADMTITGSSFTGNTAGRYGGALYATFNSQETSSKIVLNGCGFDGNQAKAGGGAVYALSGLQPVSVDACTFAQNRVTGDGCGGGAMEVRAPHTYIDGSKFTGNASQGEGPAIKLQNGVLHFNPDTFDHNARGGTYEYGEDVALDYGYNVGSLALLADGQSYKKNMNIGERAELVIGCDAKEAPFVIETSDASVLELENGGAAKKADGGYAAAFTAESPGNAKITLREDRGKIYAVLDVSVGTLSARCRITGISFEGLQDTPVEWKGNTLAAEVPAGTDVTRLIPTVSFEGVSISPKDKVPMDFSSPVVFTVTSQTQKTARYEVSVKAKGQAQSLEITGVPDNRIVYAGGNYTIKASVPGGVWSYFSPTATAKAEGATLELTPCGAGGGWIEYEVATEEGVQKLRGEYTVIPALLPVTGQSMDVLALLIVLAAMCAFGLRLLSGIHDS